MTDIRELVLTADRELFTEHDLSTLDRNFSEDYVEHSPLVANGKDGLQVLHQVDARTGKLGVPAAQRREGAVKLQEPCVVDAMRGRLAPGDPHRAIMSRRHPGSPGRVAVVRAYNAERRL